MQPRDLVWDGCLNVRELGGLATRDGRTTRFGAVVRADSVRQLSGEGRQALFAHGIRIVVDLRGDHEWAEDPPGELPVEVVHMPFMETREAELGEVRAELAAVATAAPDVPSLSEDRSCAAAAMVGVPAELEHCYGGVESFLGGAGVTDGEIELVRARLRG